MININYYEHNEIENILNAIPHNVRIKMGINTYWDEKNRTTTGDCVQFTNTLHNYKDGSYGFLIDMQLQLTEDIKNETANAKRWADHAKFSKKKLEIIESFLKGVSNTAQPSMKDICITFAELNKEKWLAEENEDEQLAKEVVSDILENHFTNQPNRHIGFNG